jgi:hypothetical protein
LETFREESIPHLFSLCGFPNPAEEWLTLTFQAPAGGQTEIELFTMTGQEVMRTVRNLVSSGRNEITIDVSGLQPGVYTCRLKSGDFVASEKLVIR